MADLDLDDFRRLLIAQREELESVADAGDEAASTVELDQTRVGRLSRMDALRAQAMSVEAQRRRETNLRRIAAALRRIDTGDFGFCAGCDEPVDPRRLAVDPAATHCVSCASQQNNQGDN